MRSRIVEALGAFQPSKCQAMNLKPNQNIFKFGPPRAVAFTFALPPWLRAPKDVFRVDADGIHETKWRSTEQGVVIEDTQSRDAIYVATHSPAGRAALEQRRQSALAGEAAHPAEREALELLKK